MQRHVDIKGGTNVKKLFECFTTRTLPGLLLRELCCSIVKLVTMYLNIVDDKQNWGTFQQSTMACSSLYQCRCIEQSTFSPAGALRYRGGPHLRYVFRGRRGLFLRPPHVREFVKEGYFFVPRYEVWGSKSPCKPRNIRGSDAE